MPPNTLTKPRLPRSGAPVLAVRREQRRRESVTRREADVQVLRHAPQYLDHSRGLGRGDSQGGQKRPFAQPENSSRGGGSAEDAAGAGDVPALLIVAGETLCRPALCKRDPGPTMLVTAQASLKRRSDKAFDRDHFQVGPSRSAAITSASIRVA